MSSPEVTLGAQKLTPGDQKRPLASQNSYATIFGSLLYASSYKCPAGQLYRHLRLFIQMSSRKSGSGQAPPPPRSFRTDAPGRFKEASIRLGFGLGECRALHIRLFRGIY